MVDTGRGLGEVLLSRGKLPREHQQDEYVRTMEIDPAKYYPTDVKRDLVFQMPSNKAFLEGKVKEKREKMKSQFTKGD